MTKLKAPDPAELAWLNSMRRVYPMALAAREVGNKPARPTIIRKVRDSALGLLDEMAPRDEVLLQQLREQTGSCHGDCNQGRSACKTPALCTGMRKAVDALKTTDKLMESDAAMALAFFCGGVVCTLLCAALWVAFDLRGVL